MPLPATSPGFVHRLAARSGWSRSTPVSITATTTDGSPSVCDQAPAASTPKSPVSPQRSSSLGSVGRSATRTTTSGPAHFTIREPASNSRAASRFRRVSTRYRPASSSEGPVRLPPIDPRTSATSTTVASSVKRTSSPNGFRSVLLPAASMALARSSAARPTGSGPRKPRRALPCAESGMEAVSWPSFPSAASAAPAGDDASDTAPSASASTPARHFTMPPRPALRPVRCMPLQTGAFHQGWVPTPAN